MNRLVVIDAHPVAYRAFYSPGTAHLKTSNGIASGVFYGVLNTFQALKKQLPKSAYLFCFDSFGSWRNAVYPHYKKRTQLSKPDGFIEQLDHVREFLIAAGVSVLRWSELEADDLISLVVSAWNSRSPKSTSVIVSSDRDFFQLVSKKTLCYDDRAKIFYGPEDVWNKIGVPPAYIVNYKCLLGDVADGIKGIRGYGKVKAARYAQFVHPSDFLSEGDTAIFNLNHHLICLPRSMEYIPLDIVEQTALKEDIRDTLEGLSCGNVRAANLERVQELLSIYEVRKFKIEDFIER